VRIVGGRLRGRRLRSPRGRAIRPTSDRTRESIFDLLGPGPHHGRVLDLFSGTGALGIEALSRGFERAVFVERDRVARELIQANLSLCELESASRVSSLDVTRFLEALDSDAPFSLVLLDPPYGQGLAAPTLEALSRPGWVAEEGMVLCETEAALVLSENLGSLSLAKHKRYGDTGVWLYVG
jgi:16S rRNA (guanine966-N2)-methyltransferase